jgi:hypothetical protein
MATMVALLTQSTSSSESAALFIPIVFVSLLAFIPASIAKKKGYSAGAFYVFGFFLFLIALIVALVLKDKNAALPATQGGSGISSGISWMHTGVRYLSGYTVDNPYYGIWDRQVPGQPIAKFPYTEHGKAEATARFQELEPQGQAVAPATLPLPPP